MRLAAMKHGAILNDYNFGGYLDFVGIPPFIDGRAELYGDAYMLRYDRALNLHNLPDFLRLLDEYRIGATLLAPSTPAVALLDRSPDWQRVYSDDIAVVHVGAPSHSSTKIVTTQAVDAATALVFNRTDPQPPPGALRTGEDAMALEALIILVIVGAIAGWLAGQIVKGIGFG